MVHHKRLIAIFAMLCCICSNILGQNTNKTISLSEFYENSNSRLISSKKFYYDTTLSNSIVMEKIKNWAGVTFVNAENVIVSETNSQIVFNYSNTNFHHCYYLRLIVKIGNGSISSYIYDDGNCYIPFSKYYPGKSARTMFFDKLFNKKGYCKYSFNKRIVDVKYSVQQTLKYLEDSVISEQK